ncbi:hypothetical protein HOE37_01425 [Candidatus Woesearchaeota archaeon]|jgi:hypothetical protein|nr:hypothetical protein [Candidatus Woesearchaeota archaeon]MBT4335979.1 hypothetical protein [Candidatus Woesearchaeota archaeon]MBT4469042.1 hypothetical protein [Candidatus Woesearchaeota archaeon]MBT6744639.1 hypothetical protein [Candidatus Woesearchaeota archaeon]
MIKKIGLSMLFFTFLLLVSTIADPLYSVSLVNTDQGLAYSNTEITEGKIPPLLNEGTVTIKIIDFSGNMLYENKVSPPLFQPFQLFVPYYKNGKEIKIITDNEVPLSIEVNHFADTCGNDICEDHENFDLCKDDCAPNEKDSYCNKETNNVCDPDCTEGEDIDCEKEKKIIGEDENINYEESKEAEKEKVVGDEKKEGEKGFPWWIILLLLVISLFIALIIFLIGHDKKKHENERLKPMSNYIQKYLQQGYLLKQIKLELIKSGYKEKDIEKAYRLVK